MARWGARALWCGLVVAGSLVAGCGRAPEEGAGGAEENGDGHPGLVVFRTTCAACHQRDGRGVPGLYPPIAGTPMVTGDRGRLIRLVLNGMSGPVEVQGQRYNNVMPAQRNLSDRQIADLLTFVRDRFGEGAGPVKPEEVAAVRAATTREGPWTAEELEVAVGIPGQ